MAVDLPRLNALRRTLGSIQTKFDQVIQPQALHSETLAPPTDIDSHLQDLSHEDVSDQSLHESERDGEWERDGELKKESTGPMEFSNFAELICNLESRLRCLEAQLLEQKSQNEKLYQILRDIGEGAQLSKIKRIRA